MRTKLSSSSAPAKPSTFLEHRSGGSPTRSWTRRYGCVLPCTATQLHEPGQLRQYLEFYRDLGVKDLYRVSASRRRPRRPLRLPRRARYSHRTAPARCRRTTPSKPFVSTSAIAAMPLLRAAQQDRVRRRRRAGEARIRRRGSGRGRRRPGNPVRRSRRPVAHADDREAPRSKEGIPHQARERVHLQRREVPPAGESHAAAR